MKKEQKILIGLLHLTLPLFLTGCGVDEDPAATKQENNVDEQVEVKKDQPNSEATVQEEDNSQAKPKLAGTCPNGLHCSAPGSCGLFTDTNTNDLCDRGE